MVRMGRRMGMDTRARRVALGLGASRVAMGITILLAPRRALGALGFGGTDDGGRALARLGGGRDVAVGALTLAARGEPAALRTMTLVGGACDVADAVSLGASIGRPQTRQAAVGGIFSGGAAALLSLWAWRRLGR